MWKKNVLYGIVNNNDVYLLEGNILDDFLEGKKICELQDVNLLAPVESSLVVGIGGNYHGLLKIDKSIHSRPTAFLKPPSTIIGHLEKIIYPSVVNAIHMEGELAVIIKKKAMHVKEENAFDYVLGYTCANDVTAHIDEEESITRLKSFYTFCPIGPCIETDLDPDNTKITSRLNGELVQDADPTGDMVFNVRKLISYVTEFMTLKPFDIILTGTSMPPARMKIGDLTEVEIEGIGTLRNMVSEA